jgi:hypothetical protein
MNKLRNQHFVPRFYLKNFSFQHDKKSLSIWIIKTNKYIRRGSLANQACSNYFYSQGITVEQALGQIETNTAPIINTIIDEHVLPPRESPLHYILLAFVVSLSLRTKFQADAINESGDQLFKMMYKEHPAVKGNEDRFYIASKEAPLLALQSLETAVILSFDLNYKLLLNDTDRPFITSDNPVIKHNQYLIEDRQMSHIGFASTGFQLLLPLSPFVCLIFYDQSVYRIGNRQDSTIILSNQNDIDVINEFQYINADEALYFNEKVDQIYLRGLANRTLTWRKKSKTVVNEYEVPPVRPGTKRAIIHLRPSIVSKSLDISSIRIIRKAKRNLQAATFDLFRNPKLANQILDQEEARIKSSSGNPSINPSNFDAL